MPEAVDDVAVAVLHGPIALTPTAPVASPPRRRPRHELLRAGTSRAVPPARRPARGHAHAPCAAAAARTTVRAGTRAARRAAWRRASSSGARRTPLGGFTGRASICSIGVTSATPRRYCPIVAEYRARVADDAVARPAVDRRAGEAEAIRSRRTAARHAHEHARARAVPGRPPRRSLRAELADRRSLHDRARSCTAARGWTSRSGTIGSRAERGGHQQESIASRRRRDARAARYPYRPAERAHRLGCAAMGLGRRRHGHLATTPRTRRGACIHESRSMRLGSPPTLARGPRCRPARLRGYTGHLRTAKRLPTTSQPSIGDFLAVYEPLLARGLDRLDPPVERDLRNVLRRPSRRATVSAGRGRDRIHVIDSQSALRRRGPRRARRPAAAARGASAQEVVRPRPRGARPRADVGSPSTRSRPATRLAHRRGPGVARIGAEN